MPNLEFEIAQMDAGYPSVAGVDEAGRGPLAGPVSAAAVILPSEFAHDLLDDSKKLTEKRREILYDELTSCSEIIWGHSYAEEDEISEINILKATHTAMARAVKALTKLPDFCLIDGLDVPGFPVASRSCFRIKKKTLCSSYSRNICIIICHIVCCCPNPPVFWISIIYTNSIGLLRALS